MCDITSYDIEISELHYLPPRVFRIRQTVTVKMGDTDLTYMFSKKFYGEQSIESIFDLLHRANSKLIKGLPNG